ncbi:MAG: carbohydrate-binding family 9-like protein [Acidobacteriia bacterium]|nr:carbohydrate-binding family 9-like protein [Terriglobia bacterium]
MPLKLALILALAGPALPALLAQEPAACDVARPTANFSISHVESAPELNLDPQSPVWKNAKSALMVKDCSRTLDYPDLKTEIRAFWTDTDLYLLFVCPYRSLNLFQPTQNDQPRRGLWDRDVVEMFLGDDWDNIRHYREFEIAPTADWIDLAIDLDHRGQNRNWRSGWKTMARIDEQAKIWYAACQIPLKSVSEKEVKPGTRWRANLYRIDGDGPDPQRRFMCWQPTCVVNRDPNHVPENFGTLIFAK